MNAGTELCLQLEMAPHHSEIKSMRILVWHFQSKDTFLTYLLQLIFFISGNFSDFFIAFGYGNANEFETKQKQKLTEIKN